MLNAADTALRETLTAAGIDTRDIAASYIEEPRGKFHGTGAFVARPASTAEVSRIVAAANAARVPIIPYGGGTGLVGGQIQPGGPVPLILSLERMRAIREIHPEENTLIAEAGATLADVQHAAEEADRLFPLSYASQGTARIGGALSVNSGGLNVLRYGTARDLCLGLEAVLPNGDILHGLKRLRKDNTGYDLRNLLIGAEGTLGVVTAATLKLSPRPDHHVTAFLAVANPTSALSLLTRCRDALGETVSAFELISRSSFEFLGETYPELRQPFKTPPDWAVLLEIGGAKGQDSLAALEGVLTEPSILDGRLAQNGAQRAEFWTLRETIPEANRRTGAIASHDISLPLSEISSFLNDTDAALQKLLPCRINTFGHLGDGNLHYNIFPPKGETRDTYMPRAQEATRLIHDAALARGGSFSAEHGIGRLKAAELAERGDPAKLAAMRAIKQALDPNGIMNPGAVLTLP